MKNSITQIKNQVEQLEANLKTFKANNKGINWNEAVSGETNNQDYVDSIDFIITQLKYLIKSHIIFSQITTFEDRTSINDNLINLNGLNSPLVNGYPYVNNIIKILQPLSFYILSRGKFANDLMVEIAEMLEKKALLEKEIVEFESLKDQNVKINQEFQDKAKEIEEKNQKLLLKIEEIEETYTDLNEKLENAKTEGKEITEILTEAKSEKGIFDGFIQNVSSRESELIRQKTETENYESKLLKFQKDIKTKVAEAENLIRKSEEVLNLSTSEGISAAFNTQYKEAGKWWVFGLWLFFSTIFLALAVWIGWLLLSAESQDLPTVIARISLLPILLTGAYFAANQYVKQKNIAEDYAYKQVLSKSLVGFSGEILKQSKNNNPEYSQFVTKVFDQMLQDPLRNRKEKSFEIDYKSENLIDTMTKLLAEINKINKP